MVQGIRGRCQGLWVVSARPSLHTGSTSTQFQLATALNKNRTCAAGSCWWSVKCSCAASRQHHMALLGIVVSNCVPRCCWWLAECLSAASKRRIADDSCSGQVSKCAPGSCWWQARRPGPACACAVQQAESARACVQPVWRRPWAQPPCPGLSCLAGRTEGAAALLQKKKTARNSVVPHVARACEQRKQGRPEVQPACPGPSWYEGRRDWVPPHSCKGASDDSLSFTCALHSQSW